MKKILILCSITLFLGFITACSTTTDPADLYKGESPGQIFAKGRTALKGKSYSEAVKRFEALDVQYPYGHETELAQLYLIYAYYQKEDYALSVAAADHFIRLHPTSQYIAYAYFMRGKANYYQNLGIFEKLFVIDLATRDLSQIQKSYADFNEVATRYPESRYAAPAHQEMIYLRNVMADAEVHIAEFYYERKAYVAAANRASWLAAHYQGAPQARDGLILMAKSYHQLGAKKLEQDALTVLQYNYPGVVVDFNTKYGVIVN